MQQPYRKQEPPFCVQVELAEGCNLACTFCGINGIRAKAGGPLKFMTPALAERLAKQIREARWNPRIEFAMHGEPTTNPDWLEILTIFRKYLPHHNLMMTSNGGGLLKSPGPSAWLTQAFKYLDTFALDNYRAYKVGEKVLQDLLMPPDVLRLRYPENGSMASPHNRRGAKEPKRFIVVQDIAEATKGNHSTLSNHAGCAGPPVRISKACVKTFREMGIRWDGNMAVCCNDWRGVYKIGNIAKEPIDVLWQKEEMGAARRFLLHGERVIPPCDKCDYTGYRIGLLPDPKGNETLPKPTKADLAIAARACAGAPYSEPNFRPWEK